MSKSKKRAAPKPAKKQTSTALAVRKPSPVQTLRIQVNDPERLLPAKVAKELETIHAGVLGETATTENLGLVELKLTEQEELILSEPINADEVLVKPNGVPYLSHPSYTKWFIRAFGRLGWSLVPKATPKKAESGSSVQVIVPYILYVHGHPVAFAQGEQEYFPKNRDQSFGDAIEATVASALRRCAKHLGVGLELWDKKWLYDFLTTRCIQVKVRDRDGKAQTKWRLKDGPPLPYEIAGPGVDMNPGASYGGDDWREELEQPVSQGSTVTPRVAPNAGTTDKDGDKISEPQRRRLATIATKAGRNMADVKLYLQKVWKVSSSKDLTRRDYDRVCAALEAKGPLPMPGDGGVE